MTNRKNDWFNPTVKEFLEDNKDVSIIGFAWSIWWRLYTVIFVGAFILGMLFGL